MATAEQLLDAWRASVPDELEAQLDESGWIRLFEALAAQAAVVSEECRVRLVQGQLISEATGAGKARGTLRIRRTVAGAAGVLLSGATFQTARRIRVVTLADVTIPAGAGGTVDVLAEALLPGLAGNLRSGVALAFEEGEFSGGLDLGGEIDAATAGAWTGGTDAQLEALGADRGLVRQDGEDVELYRSRVAALPDGVSPSGIVRVVRRILRQLTGQLRPTVILHEHHKGGVAGDVDPADASRGPCLGKGNPPGSLVPYSLGGSKCWFTIYIDPLPESAMSAADVCAAGVMPAGVEGDPAARQKYGLIYQAIRRAKGAGIGVALALRTEWPVDAYGYGPDYDYGWRYDYDEGTGYPEELTP